jgi:hypothetical protein
LRNCEKAGSDWSKRNKGQNPRAEEHGEGLEVKEVAWAIMKTFAFTLNSRKDLEFLQITPAGRLRTDHKRQREEVTS